MMPTHPEFLLWLAFALSSKTITVSLRQGRTIYPCRACNTLDAIETAVEEWRKKALPAIEKALLTHVQEEAIAKKKKA